MQKKFQSQLLALLASWQKEPKKQSVQLLEKKSERGHSFQVGDHEFFTATDFPEDVTPPNLDFALFGAAAIAIRNNLDIETDIPVTQSTVDAVNRSLDLLRTWHASKVFSAKIACRNVVDPPEPSRNQDGLILMSGGVDATYFALREAASGAVSNALFFSGMSHRLQRDKPYFTGLRDRVREMSEEIGLQFLSAEMTFPKHALGNEIGHGFRCAMILARHGHMFGEGVVSADFNLGQEYAYFPWGNSYPLISALGSGTFPIRQAVTEHGRTEKVRFIGKTAPDLASKLVVCHMFMKIGRNCGKCAKCIRTGLNFAAAGIDPPEDFLSGQALSTALEALSMYRRQVDMRRELVFLNDVINCMSPGPLRSACKKRRLAVERKTIRTGGF